jgi:F-type H+-transporting ATPase subunit b
MHLLLFAESIQLFPDGTLFVHVAMILIMIWVLNRTLYRPINRIITSREKHKGGKSGEAAAILKETEEKETRYNREMLDARSAGYELIEKEQKDAVAERDKAIGEVKAEVAEKFDAGRAELKQQTDEARAAIGTDAEKIADSIAASILKS